LFTDYVFADDLKYPQFFPVNGSRSGASVTTRRSDPYPHHSSLFFACDRVNGGNYWQEGLERGRIVSKKIRLIQDEGSRIEFEQESRWERPGAEAPFKDHRKISISAPSPDLRVIDVNVTLTALIAVSIQKNNHTLFAARMAPDLTTVNEGALNNEHADSSKKDTFANTS